MEADATEKPEGTSRSEHVELKAIERLWELQAGRNRTENKLTKMMGFVVESLGEHMAQLNQSITFIHDDIASLNVRLDTLTKRIERRLELTETGTSPPKECS